MKPHEIDRLFQEKLAKHEAIPQSVSWQQLSEKLQHSKKKKNAVYWRVAAVVCLLLLGAWAIVSFQNTKVEHALATTTTSEQPTNNVHVLQPAPTDLPVESAVAQQTEEKPTKVNPVIKTEAVPRFNQTPKRTARLATTLPAVPDKKDVPGLEPEPVNTIKAIDEVLVAGFEPAEALQATTSQKETEEKEMVIIEYIPGHSNPLASTTTLAAGTGQKEESKVSKLLKKVQDVEIDLISLREAKNDLIAARLQP